MREIISRLSTRWISLLAGAVILLSPGLYNGYPLVTADTAAYVGSGTVQAAGAGRLAVTHIADDSGRERARGLHDTIEAWFSRWA